MPVTATTRDLEPYLEHVRALPFVRALEVRPELGQDKGRRLDAVLRLRTPRGTYQVALEVKRTFLDRTLTHALIAQQQTLERQHRRALFLVARYIPRPTGERLAEAGINFVDRVGNIHLNLGRNYHVLILGRREEGLVATARRPGSALIQTCFVLLAEPQAVTWPVRKLAEAAGIGKTVAALARRRLLQAGTIRRLRTGLYQLVDLKTVQEEFLVGYGQILRPHILIGTFRPQQSDPDLFVQQLVFTAKERNINWALTGGPGAYALKRFYRGQQTPIFVEQATQDFLRELKLLPDSRGPVTLLQAFAKTVFWRGVVDPPVAHPWLIYAELMHQGDRRALDAAEEIREDYLQP